VTTPIEPALSMERPFPGLRPFTYADREFFFGRNEQAYALYRLIDRGRFLAVVGSSGSGKSSLVRAGLRGLLELESADPAGRKWLYREMRPGAAPLAGLAEALASLSRDEDEEIAAARKARIDYRLRQSSLGMADALAETEGLDEATLLLVVDQFEELFRYAVGTRRARPEEARSRDEAAQFVQILLEVARRQAGNVHVLITMRSDFIGDCARFHGLPEAVSTSQYLVPSLTRDQLEDVIREPIRKAGASVEPQLVERLLNDSANEPDQLPVLQHCLLQLWERAGLATKAAPGDAASESLSAGPGTPHDISPSAIRHLTLGDYEAIGRIAGALSRHADAILAKLSVR
jgi:energy-coupling factor transporter ATP-binding protein EcfA2